MLRFKNFVKFKAFSLAEIILAMGLFAAVFSGTAFFAVDTLRFTKNNEKKIYASLQIQETINAITLNKNDFWINIVNSTDAGTKSILFQNGRYSIVNGSSTKDGVTTSFVVTKVFRDSNGNIVTTGGTEDPHSRAVTITASWTDIVGATISTNSRIYLNDWNTKTWKQSTQAEFNTGSHFQTRVTNNSDGEVSVDQIFYPDWCKPSLAISAYDIPGNATAKTVFARTGNAFLGTAGNTSGVALTKLNITGVTPPSLTVEGTFNGYLTNNIYVSGDYAYLSTTDNSKEVVILDITTSPYSEVGYFNASGSTDANSVVVSGNTGFVAVGRKVYSFNLSSKTGSRPVISEITLVNNPNFGHTNDAKVSKIAVNGNYLFASLDEDYYELVIANVSNPSNMSITSNTSVNNQQTFDIYVSTSGNRVYFGTGSSSYEREFFIINTSSKSGSRPVIGSYDTSGMSVYGIAIIEADNRALLVGFNGEEYQAVNISNESSPTRCGGLQYNSGINDVDPVIDSQGNAFSYIVTNNATQDFQILRGGPGVGGGDNGYGYLSSGEYTSIILDTNSSLTYYYILESLASIPSGSTVRLQVRASNNSNMSGANWVGPDGQTNTYFTGGTIANLPASLNNNRYFQYKVYFESNTFSAPELQEIEVNYQ